MGKISTNRSSTQSITYASEGEVCTLGQLLRLFFIVSVKLLRNKLRRHSSYYH